MPNNIKQLIKPPRIKYFRPASEDLGLVVLNEARAYPANACNSNPQNSKKKPSAEIEMKVKFEIERFWKDWSKKEEVVLKEEYIEKIKPNICTSILIGVLFMICLYGALWGTSVPFI